MSGQGCRVLYASADAETAKRVRAALRAVDPSARLDHVRTVEEGLDRLAGADCVVCGPRLTDGDATGFLERVRERSDLPVVAFAPRDSEVAAAAVGAGGPDWIPGDPDDAVGRLLDRVGTLVAGPGPDPAVGRGATADGGLVEGPERTGSDGAGRSPVIRTAARELRSADAAMEVGDIAVEAAADAFGGGAALYGYDRRRDRLDVLATAGTPGPVEGDGPPRTAFDEKRVVTDVGDSARTFAPAGDRGVLLVARHGPLSAAERDDLAILAALVEAALARVARHGTLDRHSERVDELTDALAHELRGPIASAKAWLEIAVETGDDDLLADVDRTLDRLDGLVEGLSSVAPRDHPVVDPEPVSLSSVVREVWASLDGGGTLAVEDGLPTVEADPERVETLFGELLANAVVHGGPGVGVRVGPTPEGFLVADDGGGVDPGRREDVFEYGYTTAEDRLGAGLARVRDVARAHGWRVDLEDPGTARFEVDLRASGAESP